MTGLDGSAFAQSQAGIGQVDGDVARQALASLRGYAYQLYASALAWIALAPDETLHLEVAEDYAVSARERLDAAQIKDAPASGKLTLRHPDVITAIDSYVDLVARNPGRVVQLHLLSTAQIGMERALADRPSDLPGLDYWRRAASGAAVKPLRQILLSLKLAEPTLAFISSRDDDALRHATRTDGSPEGLLRPPR